MSHIKAWSSDAPSEMGYPAASSNRAIAAELREHALGLRPLSRRICSSARVALQDKEMFAWACLKATSVRHRMFCLFLAEMIESEADMHTKAPKLKQAMEST